MTQIQIHISHPGSQTYNSNTNIDATVIYTHSHKHTQLQLPGATTQTHLYLESNTMKQPIINGKPGF